MYRSETWCLTESEEHRLRLFKIRLPKKKNLDLRRNLQEPEENCIIFVKLHNEYCSQNIIRMGKSRRIGWAVYVARICTMKKNTQISLEILNGKNPLEDLNRDEG
jgi:hypothetical protein